MIRNKRFVAMVLCFIGVFILSTGLSLYFSDAAVWIMAAGMAVIILIFSLFTWNRYQSLKKMSAQLHQFQRSMNHLSLEEYSEGELSYLSSEIGKMATKLTEQAHMLEADKKYLADAISNISHQLKTPLTSMSMMADFLSSSTLPEEKRKEFTGNIRRQLDRIQWLVSVLLKMARLDAGSVTMKKDKVNVAALIRKASEHLLIPMELQGQELVVECQPSVEFTGDMDWMAEGLSNILKNCMEHMEGGKKLYVRVSDNPLYVRIDIEDEGCGIAKEDLPYIFQRFYKGKNASPDSVGIGLAMAAQIIHQHNGDIHVESVLGEGTKFQVKIYK